MRAADIFALAIPARDFADIHRLSNIRGKVMSKHITIGILAHVDAGKTTLSEGLLYLSGVIRNMGRVDKGDTFLDTYELERARGITIFSKEAHFDYGDISFTLLDTPGHADFSPEMERTLQVLDLAILVISAPDRVTSQGKLLFKLLDHYKVPVIVFVNKMDQLRESSEQERVDIMASLREGLSSHMVDFTKGVDDDETQEEIAVCDDALLSGFLDGERVSGQAVKELVARRKLFPVCFGSALKMNGVKELLDLISEYAPAAAEGAAAREENAAKDKNAGASEADTAPEPFGARIFKISRDSSGNRLTHIKITSGVLRIRDRIGDEKIDQIRIYSGDKFKAVQEAQAGEVCAVLGLSSRRAGEGLGVLEGDMVSEVLQPILSSVLILPDGADPAVVYRQLKSLEDEEPMLLVSNNEETGEIQLQLMGEVQKEILAHLIKTRFDLDVKFGKGNIVYKETITAPVEGVGHFEPLRHYAEVHLLLEPLEPGSGLVFDTNCSTDDLSLNWQRLILTHLGEKKHRGVLTGSEITDMKITVIAGKSHVKHTEGGDFRQATYRAVRQGLMTADSVLLEPVLDYRLEVPDALVGRALTDMQRMNGAVSGPEKEGALSVITGVVPAACFGDYAAEVASYTRGEGRIFTTLSGYAPCHNPEEVILEKGYDPELDRANSPDSVFCMHGAGTVVPWDQVREHMHVDSGWDPKTGHIETDLSDNIDMEALKELQKKIRNKGNEERSFAEVERDLRATEGELKAIFERTYGQVRPRYVETEKVYTGMTPEEKEAQRDLEVEKQKREKYENTKAVDRDEYKEYLLVDGYNIIYASAELKQLALTDLKAARDSLIDALVNFQGFRREKVILVFDAYKVPGGREHMEENAGLVIIYTKEAETADQYIEKAAHEISKKYRVTVATSDAIEQVIVMGSGAIRLSARDFLEELERTRQMIREKIGG
jgi:small GTP-binding protein